MCVCLYEQYGIHGIHGLKKISTSQLRQCGSSAFSFEEPSEMQEMDYQVSKLQNSITHTGKCLSSKKRKSFTPLLKKGRGKTRAAREDTAELQMSS